MTRKQKRLAIIGGGVSFIIAAVLLVMFAFSQAVAYFYVPGDLARAHLAPGTRIRLGGLVEGDGLTAFLARLERPHELDDLGRPGGAAPEHRAWKYWRINYAVELSAFRERAERLWALQTEHLRLPTKERPDA